MAGGDLVESRENHAGDAGVEGRAAGNDFANSGDDLVDGAGFEEVARGALGDGVRPRRLDRSNAQDFGRRS